MSSFLHKATIAVISLTIMTLSAQTLDTTIAEREILKYQSDIATHLEPLFAQINMMNKRVTMDIDAHVKGNGVDLKTTDTQIDVTSLTNHQSQIKLHSIFDAMVEGSMSCRASVDLDVRNLLSEIFVKFDTLNSTPLNTSIASDCPTSADAGITLGKFIRIPISTETVDINQILTDGRGILSDLRQKPLWTVVSQKNEKTYILEPNIDNIASVFRLTEAQIDDLIYNDDLSDMKVTITIGSPNTSSMTLRHQGVLTKVRRNGDAYVLSVKDGPTKVTMNLSPSLLNIIYKDGNDTKVVLNYKNDYLTIQIQDGKITSRIEGPYSRSGNADLIFSVAGLKIGSYKSTVQGNSFVSHGSFVVGDPAEFVLTFDISGSTTTGDFKIERPTDFTNIDE